MARRRTNRRVDHDAKRKSTSRHQAVKHPKDKHVGHKIHTRTVNAPKAW